VDADHQPTDLAVGDVCPGLNQAHARATDQMVYGAQGAVLQQLIRM
jgi:hypothetical protein